MAAVARFFQRFKKVHDGVMYWRTNVKPSPNDPGFKDTTGMDLPPGVRIPDWRVVKVKDNENLADVERLLDSEGLKNPWLRNYAWRPGKNYGIEGTMKYAVIFWDSMKYGVLAFVLYEAFLYLTTRGDDEHGHGHGHGHEDDKYPLLYELKQKQAAHH